MKVYPLRRNCGTSTLHIPVETVETELKRNQNLILDVGAIKNLSEALYIVPADTNRATGKRNNEKGILVVYTEEII